MHTTGGTWALSSGMQEDLTFKKRIHIFVVAIKPKSTCKLTHAQLYQVALIRPLSTMLYKQIHFIVNDNSNQYV